MSNKKKINGYTNSTLNRAKSERNDEFYTKIETIEKEIPNYKDYLSGKTVYCNCDSVHKSSNFIKYFTENFDNLSLKRLIATSYKPLSRGSLYEYDGKKCINVSLKSDGNFLSSECVRYLKEADVVITNPPFSMLRDFIKLLYRHDKGFIILANLNVIVCKDVNRFVIDNKLWTGASIKSGSTSFRIPDEYAKRFSVVNYDDDGSPYSSLGGVRWITNIEHSKRVEPLKLTKKYCPKKYPFCDNYPEIVNVDVTNDIPMDYYGIMCVPITFIDKYNPKQFRIIDTITPYIDGKERYKRLVIERIENEND